MFSVTEYAKSKSEIIELIKASSDWNSTEGFIADGLISPVSYEKSPLKIAVLLGESYGYDECGVVDIETQPEDDILGIGHLNRQTSKKVPALLWMIYKSIEDGHVPSYDEKPNLLKTNNENTVILQKTLLNAAWINVKKASRHIDKFGNDATRQNYKEIYSHAIKNKDILKKQIDSISAKLFILCSDPVCHAIRDMELLGNNISKEKKWKIQENTDGKKILHVSHPSYYRDWGYKGMFETTKTIFNSIDFIGNTNY